MTFACLASTADTVLGRYRDEPGLNGAEISPVERGSGSGTELQGCRCGAAASASLYIISAGERREEGLTGIQSYSFAQTNS